MIATTTTSFQLSTTIKFFYNKNKRRFKNYFVDYDIALIQPTFIIYIQKACRRVVRPPAAAHACNNRRLKNLNIS
jgi:hypothetical protein